MEKASTFATAIERDTAQRDTDGQQRRRVKHKEMAVMLFEV